MSKLCKALHRASTNLCPGTASCPALTSMDQTREGSLGGHNPVQVKALSTVKASALQLLPFYIRIGATLSDLFPDIGQGLVKKAEDEFSLLLVGGLPC